MLEEAMRSIIREAVREAVRDELKPYMDSQCAPTVTSNTGYLTPAEAAIYAKVDRYTIYAWVNGGRLKSHRAGTRLRIRRQDLELFLSQCGDQSNSPSEQEITARALQIVAGSM